MKEFIEKLIERLEESEAKIEFALKGCNVNEFIQVKAVKRIINELAEEYKGGFCEWTPHDREIDVYFTQCGQAHIFCDGNPEENSHKFCPYCGKKIKVVE